MNGFYDIAQSQIALINQCRVQASLGAVVIGIKIADGAGIAAAVLIVALVGRDERNGTCPEPKSSNNPFAPANPTMFLRLL